MLSTTSFPVLLALYLLCLPALITPALLAASSTNLTSPSLSEIEHWQYSIPKTTLLLRMAAYPPQKIDRRALGQTLLRAQTRVREHISRYGDGELWDEDDPFQTDHAHSGKCWVGIASPATVPGAGDVKLNYTTVALVLQGLWQFTYLGKRECEIIFKVEDKARERRREGEELVGLGKLLRGNVPAVVEAVGMGVDES